MSEGTEPEVVRSELHTYPDGSAIVGTPPWPEKSPKQIAAERLERVGAPAEPAGNVVTAGQVETAAAPATATSKKR